MTSEPGQRYEIRFQPAARQAIAHRLPEAVAAAVLEFFDAALAVSQRTESARPIRAARRLSQRLARYLPIVYRIDETSRTIDVLDNDHRPEIYRRRQ